MDTVPGETILNTTNLIGYKPSHSPNPKRKGKENGNRVCDAGIMGSGGRREVIRYKPKLR